VGALALEGVRKTANGVDTRAHRVLRGLDCESCGTAHAHGELGCLLISTCPRGFLSSSHHHVRGFHDMSSDKARDLDDYEWTMVFEAVLAPEGPSQDIRPLLSVCRRWKVPFLARHPYVRE
jgi:hypothetical protein